MAKATIAYFGKGKGDADASKEVWGGKGAGLLQMSAMGLNVPPGLVIPTSVCLSDDAEVIGTAIKAAVDYVHEQPGLRLYSVRSGAPISMPGMMDTILNVGITSENFGDYVAVLGKSAAYDCRRRLIEMLGVTAFGIDASVFLKSSAEVEDEADGVLAKNMLLCKTFEEVFESATHKPFPDTVAEQLRAAIGAVWLSWRNPRAVIYRNMHNIPETMGTACVVQRMVFGNLNEDSGTGVLFSRDPSSGLDEMSGEYLTNAQGEDVVAGTHTPLPLDAMLSGSKGWAAVHTQLWKLSGKLEEHYRDMVDIEFTVENGELFILQCRAGKRSALAAFKIAASLLREGKIEDTDLPSRLTAEQFKLVQQPTVHPAYAVVPDFVGLPACPGVVNGYAAFTLGDLSALKLAGKKSILVRAETDPDDIELMQLADGVLTVRGGATSHAAVVARSMNKPCVVGCGSFPIDDVKGESDLELAIDGSSGRVWANCEVPVIDGAQDADVRFIMEALFDMSGYARQVTVPTPERHVHQRVCVSRWWGDLELLDKVLKVIAAEPASYTLDISDPNHHEQSSDDELLDGAFGVPSASKGFYRVLIDRLLAASITGLTVVGAPVHDTANFELRDAGYRVPGTVAVTVADFLAGGIVTKAFVANVLGSPHVLAKLKPLAAPSVEAKDAAPLEYVTFKALSGAFVGV